MEWTLHQNYFYSKLFFSHLSKIKLEENTIEIFNERVLCRFRLQHGAGCFGRRERQLVLDCLNLIFKN